MKYLCINLNEVQEGDYLRRVGTKIEYKRGSEYGQIDSEDNIDEYFLITFEKKPDEKHYPIYFADKKIYIKSNQELSVLIQDLKKINQN